MTTPDYYTYLVVDQDEEKMQIVTARNPSDAAREAASVGDWLVQVYHLGEAATFEQVWQRRVE